MIVVDIALATICFAGHCNNVLIGEKTPRGEFQLQLRLTESEGYGGDVIQFMETDTTVFAIHRTWNGRPAERRAARIKSTHIKDRVITHGCINVEPVVYDELKECCMNDKLIIK